MKTQSKIEYPYINKLNIPIHIEGNIHHLLVEDIKKALTKKQFELFHEYFGINTGLVRKDGVYGLYPIDVECCLQRVLTGKEVNYFD